MFFTRAGMAVVIAISFLGVASAAPSGAGCSSDSFSIDGSSLAIGLCPAATGGTASKAAVTETLTVKGQPPLVRPVFIDLLPGADTSRTIDDAPLEKLGIAKTLHLTIAYKNGSAHLEHALLVPGAIALK
jgi:hypothetical protein